MELSVLTLVLLVLVWITPLFLFRHGVKMFIFFLTTDIPGPSLWELVTVYAKRLMSDGDILSIFLDLCISYDYKLCGIWMNGDYLVFVSDHDSISTVITGKSTTEKPALMYDNVAKFGGKGMITLKGREYKRHRKLLGPAFRKDLLEAHIPRLNMELEEFLLQLEAKANGGMVCIQDMMKLKSMSIAFNILLSGNYVPDDIPRMLEAIQKLTELTLKKTLDPIGYWLDRSNKRIEEDVNAFMTEMKKVFLEAKSVASALEQDDRRRPNHFEVMYQKSMEEGEGFTDEEFFGECKTLLGASSETTAFTALACLYCLALYPEEQERVYEELKSIFGDSRRDVGPADLAQMVYLEQAIMETMRILPPVAVIARRADEDIILNGFKVPEGSVVLPVLVALHRNPNMYEDPYRFDPTRFSPENCAKRPKFSFAPFSGGSRDCPGQMQAYMVTKMLVSCVVRNFEVCPGEGLEKVEDIKIKLKIISRLPDLPLRFVVRRERI